MNIKKWYSKRSATEKGALISGAFLLAIAIITILHQRSQLAADNQDLKKAIVDQKSEIQRLSSERDAIQQRLAPFEAIAAKSFPNQEDRQRLDLLIQTIEELNRKYGSFELRRSDALQFSQDIRVFAEEYQKIEDKKPKVHLVLYATATDASRRLFEQFRTSLVDAGWNVDVKNDLLREPIERGIWIHTKNPKEPSKQHLFWNHLFVKFGLNLKNAYWGPDIPEDEVVIVINDPSYIR